VLNKTNNNNNNSNVIYMMKVTTMLTKMVKCSENKKGKNEN